MQSAQGLDRKLGALIAMKSGQATANEIWEKVGFWPRRVLTHLEDQQLVTRTGHPAQFSLTSDGQTALGTIQALLG